MKITRVYYQNAITAQSHIQLDDTHHLDHQAEQLADNFVETCYQDANQAGLVRDNQVQVSYFLQRLLAEFQTQETYQFSPNEKLQAEGNSQAQ